MRTSITQAFLNEQHRRALWICQQFEIVYKLPRAEI